VALTGLSQTKENDQKSKTVENDTTKTKTWKRSSSAKRARVVSIPITHRGIHTAPPNNSDNKPTPGKTFVHLVCPDLRGAVQACVYNPRGCRQSKTPKQKQSILQRQPVIPEQILNLRQYVWCAQYTRGMFVDRPPQYMCR
jgi:hypothetical protein